MKKIKESKRYKTYNEDTEKDTSTCGRGKNINIDKECDKFFKFYPGGVYLKNKIVAKEKPAKEEDLKKFIKYILKKYERGIKKI